MQDLGQSNYIIYEWARTRRQSGRRSFYAYSSLAERALRELAMASMGRVTVTIHFQPLQFGVAAKSSIYRHKAYLCIVSTLTRNIN